MTETLIHETWGDHQALIARSHAANGGSVGRVTLQNVVVADEGRPLQLEYGAIMKHVNVAYECYGRLSPKADNAIGRCHALTGSPHAAGYYENEK